jgi:Transcriptional regulators
MQMMGKSTIKDVAKAADVSIATVSRVINGIDNVKPALKARVENAIKELGFEPNQLARGLKNDVTHTIGVIISDMANPFFMSITREIEKKVNEIGYILLVASTDDNPEKELKYIKGMMEKRVDGIIISSTGKNEVYLNSIAESGVPVIFIDRKPYMHKLDCVYMDKAYAMYNITNMLLDQGHKKICIVVGPREIMTNFDRFTGYARSIHEANMQLDNNMIMYGEFTEAFGRQALREIVNMAERPTAIISGSVQITRGILIEAKELGIKIPKDFSLVSYGNIEMSTLISPSLTYIDSLSENIGALAGDLIISRLANPHEKSEQIEVEVNLVMGESVRAINS